MKCSLSSKNSPRNTVDFEAACSVYIRFRGVNGYEGIEALGIRLGVQRWRDQEVQVARGCMTEYGPFVAMLGE